MASKPQLAYWDIRGLGEPVRLLLKYAGEDFEDKRFVQGDGPEFNKDCWYSIKFSLGLPFPNLPYYKDDNAKVTGTNAILRHIARKYGLLGDTLEEQWRSDQMLEVTMDLRNQFVNFCYGRGWENDGKPETFEKAKAGLVEDAKKRLKAFEEFLGDRKFFAGEKVTAGDFHAFEMIDEHQILEPSILKDVPGLTGFWQRFKALPNIEKYLSSPEFKARPLNNKHGVFK